MTGAVAPSKKSFSTSFAGSETPISLSGAFRQDGVDWTHMSMAGGIAFGTQTEPPSKPPFDDSYTILRAGGLWLPDQRCQATIHLASGITATHPEVWLGVRWTDSAHNARGYECNLHYAGAYRTIGGWPGPVGTDASQYNTLLDQSGVTAPQDGDIFFAQIVGLTITAGLIRSGVTIDSWSATDTNPSWMLASGNLAMGCYTDGGNASNKYGYTNFSAWEL
jgi:hypothetical protein